MMLLWILFLTLNLDNVIPVDSWQLQMFDRSRSVAESNANDVGQVLQFSRRESGSRHRRSAEMANCTTLLKEYSNCRSSKFWTLDVLKNRTSFCTSPKVSNISDCLKKFLCTNEKSCFQIARNLTAQSCELSLNVKEPSLNRSVQILKLLCPSHPGSNSDDCISNLTKVYNSANKDYKVLPEEVKNFFSKAPEI